MNAAQRKERVLTVSEELLTQAGPPWERWVVVVDDDSAMPSACVLHREVFLDLADRADAPVGIRKMAARIKEEPRRAFAVALSVDAHLELFPLSVSVLSPGGEA